MFYNTCKAFGRGCRTIKKLKNWLMPAVAAGVILAFLVAAVVLVALPNSQSKDCGAITDQNAKYDCYHALAHQTNNKSLCYMILDSEKREHCLGHIPG